MPKTTLTTFATFLVLISIIYYQAPDLIEGYSKQTHDILQCIDRASIIKRGEQWVRMHIAFNSGATYDGYRQDGAGFLCMAWNAARPGVPIGYIGALSIKISKQDLQPGDAMYCQTKHVTIFTEWGAADQSQYIGMQLSNSTGLGTIKRYIPYPYFDSDKCFHPIKCSNIC